MSAQAESGKSKAEESGKWLQRVPKSLHAKIREAAERDGVSLNLWCATALARVVHKSVRCPDCGHLPGQCGKRYGPSSALTAVGEDGLPPLDEQYHKEISVAISRSMELRVERDARIRQLRTSRALLAEKEKEVERLKGMCWKFFNAITTRPLTSEEKSALDEFRAALTDPSPATEEKPKP